MRGIVLAAGLGTSLFPMTRIINKHLLPVYDKPMIYFPIQTLVNAGIQDILLVTSGCNPSEFIRLLGNGKEFGLDHINFTYYEGHEGITGALKLARYFARDEKLCVVLGDNIIEGNIINSVEEFGRQNRGSRVFLKKVYEPRNFSVPRFNGNEIAVIEEKPASPRSNYAVTGIYLFDDTVFEKIDRLDRSPRSKLEITDVNNLYIQEGSLTWEILDGWWVRASTVDGLLRASRLVSETGANSL